MDPFPDGVNVQLMAHSYFTKRNHSYRSKVTKSLVALVALPGIKKKQALWVTHPSKSIHMIQKITQIPKYSTDMN
jgi:hypothetical protein